MFDELLLVLVAVFEDQHGALAARHDDGARLVVVDAVAGQIAMDEGAFLGFDALGPGYGIVSDAIAAGTRIVYTERGDFPGAYKLHDKEWRVPESGVEAFQNRQRQTKSDTRLSAWRRVRRSDAASRSESGQDPVTTRSTHGNAEA